MPHPTLYRRTPQPTRYLAPVPAPIADATQEFEAKLNDPKRWVSRLRDGSRKYYGIWLCKCGREKEVYDYSVTGGKSLSCGCHRSEVTTARNQGNQYGYKHGGYGTEEYDIYYGMIERCYNPKSNSFENYGGRQPNPVTVCARWLDSENGFQNFFADMGSRPPRYQIDRIDNDGNYEPLNCEWVPQKKNLRHKRNSRMVTYQGRTQCLSAWCEELNLRFATIRNRLDRGWNDAEALSTPVQHKTRYEGSHS